MQRGIERRIGNLEEFLLPLSAEVFCARVRTHARRTKTSFGSAYESLISKVSDDELETLEAEFGRMAATASTVETRDALLRIAQRFADLAEERGSRPRVVNGD